jgi:hypothetical protein
MKPQQRRLAKVYISDILIGGQKGNLWRCDNSIVIDVDRRYLQSGFEIPASDWVVELQKVKPQLQAFAKKAVNDILFLGQMGIMN